MNAPLSPRQRRRGRRLAIASHASGMVHSIALSGQLPTLALVALGAGESLVGAHRFLLLVVVLVQLPTLRLVGRLSKRRILVSGQIAAVLFTLPLLAFQRLAAADGAGLAVAFASFAACGVAFAATNTVWFPLLHGYVTPAQTGRFFGVLRTGWHLTLIPFFLGALAWLERHPGDFGPVFAVALACGVGRVVLISRLPERSERTGEPLRLREAIRFAATRDGWRAYLAGTTVASASRSVFLTFVVVLMRRVFGFSEGDVLATTAAIYAGGLVSLYVWGWAVDRVGPLPLFRWTAFGQAAVVLAFAAAASTPFASVPFAIAGLFTISLLAAGFDVADTRVLFAMTPPDTPARLLVPTTVAKSLLSGMLPLLAGLGLESALSGGAAPHVAYPALFALLAAGLVIALVPLRRFRDLDVAGPMTEPSPRTS